MTFILNNTSINQPVNKDTSSKSSDQLFLNRYKIGRNIAQGAQGQVKLALDTFSGNRVAIKLFKHRKMDELDFVYLQREVSIIQELKGHKAFVSLIQFASNVQYINGHGQSETVSAIVLEYANNGCLFDLVHFFREKYTENMIKLIGLQMIDALDHLKKLQISHRDIKLENIVLDANFNLKVIDFGLAIQESRDGKPKSNVGTNPYAPPERFLGKEYCGHQFDIFSFGVFLFFLKFHYFPFADNNPQSSEDKHSFFQFSNNRQSFWQRIIENEKVEDINFIYLLDSMFQQDPLKRPTIEEVRNHPFFESQENDIKSISIQSYLSMRKDIMNEKLKKQKKERQNQKTKIITIENKENNIQETLQQNIQPQVVSNNEIVNEKFTKVSLPQDQEIKINQETKLSSNQILSSNLSDKQSSCFNQKATIKFMDLNNKNQNQLELDDSKIVNQQNRFKKNNLINTNTKQQTEMHEKTIEAQKNNNEQLQQPELNQNNNNTQTMPLIDQQNCQFNPSAQDTCQKQPLSETFQSVNSVMNINQSLLQINLLKEYEEINLIKDHSFQQQSDVLQFIQKYFYLLELKYSIIYSQQQFQFFQNLTNIQIFLQLITYLISQFNSNNKDFQLHSFKSQTDIKFMQIIIQ